MKLKTTYTASLLALLTISQVSGEGFRLPDQQSVVQQVATPQPQNNVFGQQTLTSPLPAPGQSPVGEQRGGRSSILSLFGLGNDNDPYLARSNSNCLGGDLSECFKTQALNSFEEIFYRDQYTLSDFARVVRLPETQQRSLLQEPYEFSQEVKSEDSDWDQMVKYALRKAER